VDDAPGLEAVMVDSVGAGDSFTAALCMGLLKGWPLNKVNSFANIVAAFVCSQKGATPILPVNLVAYLERGGGVVSIQNINRLGVRYERNY
jgi:fructokinase